ncbi:Lcl C-terminal domain-containing protein [Thiomicrospira microaerophila]|uniref:Lcl C-terminal domain-containing protein n=1 Tax=Thiomicrospira microaerophila TaxID=406020 RepID=UPI000695F621|nr:DUF1566 domain-containing protein [Thiomicrospira microaerophila]
MSSGLTPAGKVAEQRAQAEAKAKQDRIDAPFRDRYVINQNGTVYDKKTNLTWMVCSLGLIWNGRTCTGRASTYDWPSARDAAASTNYAGKSDWRVPTIEELHSLVYCSSGHQSELRMINRGIVKVVDKELRGHCKGNYQKPTIFTAVFPHTGHLFYMSASPSPVSSHHVMGVFFNHRGDHGGMVGSQGGYNRVRLVRSGQ